MLTKDEIENINARLDLLVDFIEFELKFRYANNKKLKAKRREELHNLFERAKFLGVEL